MIFDEISGTCAEQNDVIDEKRREILIFTPQSNNNCHNFNYILINCCSVIRKFVRTL